MRSWPRAARACGWSTSDCGRCAARCRLPPRTCSSSVPQCCPGLHCRRCGAVSRNLPPLDGIPLAIELAASRMTSMTAATSATVSMTASGCWSAPDEAWNAIRRCASRSVVLRPARRRRKDATGACSVFAGGFKLDSACAIAGSDDPTNTSTLDLLDALVRKSLLVADRSSGTTRYSMLETIRQFAEEQLVARTVRPTRSAHAHARYFADLEADVLALWDSPRQREAYLVWRRTRQSAHRVSMGRGQRRLDDAATIAIYATALGNWGNSTSRSVGPRVGRAAPGSRPSPARGVVRNGVALLARRDASTRLSPTVSRPEAGLGVARRVRGADGHRVNRPLHTYTWASRGGRRVVPCRSRSPSRQTTTSAALVIVLTNAGLSDEAVAAAEGLVEAAEATRNPYLLSIALLAEGFAFRNADPDRALAAISVGAWR